MNISYGHSRSGISAALSLDSGVPITRIDIHKLQRWLKTDSVYLEDIPNAH
ncbi:hypothetical protein KAH55_12670 [bacterium]|nr:hypothetical protein [bacterium]